MNIAFVQADNRPCGRDASRQDPAAWCAHKISCAQELVYWFLGRNADTDAEMGGHCPGAATVGVVPGSGTRRLQVARQHLADEVLAKAVMRLFLDQLETRLVVDAARIGEDAVGPQHHARITRLAAEAQALVDQAAADAQAARAGIDIQQAQLGRRVVLAHDEDGTEHCLSRRQN